MGNIAYRLRNKTSALKIETREKPPCRKIEAVKAAANLITASEMIDSPAKPPAETPTRVSTGAEFAEWLRRRGLTIRDAASLIGVAPNSVTKFAKAGQTQLPKPWTLAILAIDHGLGDI